MVQVGGSANWRDYQRKQKPKFHQTKKPSKITSMAEINPSLLLQNHNLRSLHAALDPQWLILSQFSDSQKPQLTNMERGPRFKEYSDLRERKLRMKNLTEQQTLEKETDEKVQSRSVLTPQKKQVKFSSDFTTPPRRLKMPSVLTQSVPDFSSALRKENRKPAALPYGKVGGGSRSTEKRSGGLMARKSHANMEELKKLAVAAGKEINGGIIIGNKAVLGNRQI